MTYTDEEIAPVVHAAMIALQAVDGDECPSPPWASEDPAVQALTVRGVALARSGLPAEALHEAWCDGKRAQGWTYGEVKDRTARTHPCLVPYRQLPERQQAKDRLLRAITIALTAQAHRMRAVS
jgi:RyR domain